MQIPGKMLDESGACIMLYKIKSLFIDALINTIIAHPGFMETKLFLNAMKIFPEMISSNYETSIVKGGGNYDEVIRNGLMSIQYKPERILDICTGTGIASFIANEVFPDSRIVAIDQSESMIKIAQNKADEIGLSLIDFRIGNAVQLLESDNSFDLIITSNAPIYLSEITRVLMPGGLFFISLSFGGQSIVKMEKKVTQFFGNYGLTLLDLKNVGKGVYIISEKK